jgi:integrase
VVKRDGVLNNAELAVAWKAAFQIEWPFGPLLRLLILTGARREEIGALRWSEIQGDKIELEGVRTKNDEPHTSRGCWRASRLGWDPTCFCERRGPNLDNHTSV